jgi:hypothetical protein
MLGSARRPATACNTACGRSIRHHWSLMNRARLAFLLALVALSAAFVAACGGDDSDQASSSTDVNELLTQTFSGEKKVDSGTLDMSLRLDQTSGSGDNGAVTVRLSGPFVAGDKSELPQFQLAFAFDGGSQSVDAGATSTGDKAYVAFQGTDYVVSDQIFRQFKAGYQEAAKKSGNSGKNQSFTTLGIDPRKWITNPHNAGEAKVGDADTIKITGGIDVNKLLADINTALAKVGQLGLSGSGQVPDQLTAAQKNKVVAAVKDPRVEIYTGKDDQILRRLVVNMGVDDPSSKTAGKVALDLSITGVNDDQEISAPSGAKPFSELLTKLGGLSALSGGSSSSSSGSSGSSQKDLQQYSDCVTKAGSDVAKARKCADLLSP